MSTLTSERGLATASMGEAAHSSSPKAAVHPVDQAVRDSRPLRPWPAPRRAYAWSQSWNRLLFAHWRIDAVQLRPLLPEGLTLDQFDGFCWIGVVPFDMTGIARRPFPPLPGTAAFCELNVRTYVTAAGKPGVWFFSLDAAHRLAVRAARAWFSLPYHFAHMRSARCGQEILYSSQRAASDAEFVARYAPIGPPRTSQPGSLEYFLTERYCLYTLHRGRLQRAEVAHAPWSLQPAAARIERNTMFSALGLRPIDEPPLLHYAERMDAVVWNPKPV